VRDKARLEAEDILTAKVAEKEIQIAGMQREIKKGFIIGVLENLGEGYIGRGLKEIVGFVIILMVLMVRPLGLFGTPRCGAGVMRAGHFKESYSELVAFTDSGAVSLMHLHIPRTRAQIIDYIRRRPLID
jgi:hypothetical protein